MILPRRGSDLGSTGWQSSIITTRLHTDAFVRSQGDMTKHHCFLKNSDKFRKLYFLALLGEIGGNIPKMALLLGV